MICVCGGGGGGGFGCVKGLCDQKTVVMFVGNQLS